MEFVETENGCFYKEKPTDTIWWVDHEDEDIVGKFEFSFDMKKKFDLFGDYPYELTDKQ